MTLDYKSKDKQDNMTKKKQVSFSCIISLGFFLLDSFSWILSLVQVRVEYKAIPPQIFVSQLNAFLRDLQPPSGFRAEIFWERIVTTEEAEMEEQQQSK